MFFSGFPAKLYFLKIFSCTAVPPDDSQFLATVAARIEKP